MHLQPLDWFVAAIAVLICFAPALFVGKRAGKNTTEFFASGRSVPWWLAGLSMVATTFSSDTPNLVTDIVRRNGVAGQLGVVGVPADGHGDGVLLRPPVAPVGRDDRPRVLRDPLLGRGRAGRARVPGRLPRPAVQLHDHGDRQPGGVQDRRDPVRAAPLADAALRRRAERGVRGALRALGRAGHRHGAVLHQDDRRDGGRVLRAARPGCRRVERHGVAALAAAGAGRDQLPERAAGLHQQLGHRCRGVRHADRGAVVVGVVSRRRARRRQLHRAADARVEIRAGLARGRAVLSARPLRAAALAVDSRRALLDHRVPAAVGHPEGVPESRSRRCSATTSRTRRC